MLSPSLILYHAFASNIFARGFAQRALISLIYDILEVLTSRPVRRLGDIGICPAANTCGISDGAIIAIDLKESRFKTTFGISALELTSIVPALMSVLTSVMAVARHCEAIGTLEHVKQSISEYIDYSKCWTMSRAAAEGHILLLQRLEGKSKSNLSLRDVEEAMELAAQSGHLEVVQFFHSKYPQRGRTRCLDLAASNGHLAVLKWLHEHGENKDHLTMSAFDDSAENGHLEVVKWLHENRAEGSTTRAMDSAARSGRLDIVKWLHKHRREGCTTQAMDWAAQAGHLEVVQWLHLNRCEGCSTMAIDAAACNGHLHLVRWLHEHCNMACSCNAHSIATIRGHHHVLEWIEQTEISSAS